MRLDGSWSMTESQGGSLQFALYIRDALGLVDDAPDAVPPLVPAVPATRRPGPSDDRAWRAWFVRVLAAAQTDSPGDPLEHLLAAGPTPTLGTAATELLEEAWAWCEEREAAHVAGFRRQTHEERLAVTRLVDEVERSLGHRAAPFTLHLVTLPVAGRWELRARQDLLLFSAGSRRDPARLRAVLAPVVRELARPF
jgi:hypothetical protein